MCINVKEFFILVIYRHFSIFLNYCNALWGKERQKDGTVRGRAVITLTGLHDSEKKFFGQSKPSFVFNDGKRKAQRRIETVCDPKHIATWNWVTRAY